MTPRTVRTSLSELSGLLQYDEEQDQRQERNRASPCETNGKASGARQPVLSKTAGTKTIDAMR
jgi:hypothetical protein